MLRRRGRARASSRSTPPPISATIGRRGRCWCRRRRLPASPSISARRCRSPRTRCATSASRWPWSLARAATRRGRARRHRGRARSASGRRRSGKGARCRCLRARARRSARQRRRACAPRPRATTPPPARAPNTSSAAASSTTTAPHRRSRRAASSPIGTRAPTSSRCGTRRRRRCSCATGWPAMLGLSERQVRVIAPFVGGGFGPKIMLFYPEEVVLPWAAMKLEPADQVDRGPARAFLRHHPGARADRTTPRWR